MTVSRTKNLTVCSTQMIKSHLVACHRSRQNGKPFWITANSMDAGLFSGFCSQSMNSDRCGSRVLNNHDIEGGSGDLDPRTDRYLSDEIKRNDTACGTPSTQTIKSEVNSSRPRILDEQGTENESEEDAVIQSLILPDPEMALYSKDTLPTMISKRKTQGLVTARLSSQKNEVAQSRGGLKGQTLAQLPSSVEPKQGLKFTEKCKQFNANPEAEELEDERTSGDKSMARRCKRRRLNDVPIINDNTVTIKVLQKVAEYYEGIGQDIRGQIYRRAISILQEFSVKISTSSQAEKQGLIEDGLAKKIEEIVMTGTLRHLDDPLTRSNSNPAAFDLFTKIYSVGSKRAEIFISKGYRTLKDLKSKAHLTATQRASIDHYQDLQTSIPSDEIHRHETFVRAALKKIDRRIELVVAGSYRRGALESRDIDFIITASDISITVLRKWLFQDLIPLLFAQNYLRRKFAAGSPENGRRWHGVAVLPTEPLPIWRRVDFNVVAGEEYGAALLHFTGSELFNRGIELLAERKGMYLNEFGLWKDAREPGQGGTAEGVLIEAHSEERIFQMLEIPWRSPTDRNY